MTENEAEWAEWFHQRGRWAEEEVSVGPIIDMLMPVLLELLSGLLENCQFENNPAGLRKLADQHPWLVKRYQRVAVRKSRLVKWRDVDDTAEQLGAEFNRQLADDDCCLAFCGDLAAAKAQ